MNYTFGSDETAQGNLLSKTDFDTVVKRLRVKINADMSIDKTDRAVLDQSPYPENFLYAFISAARVLKQPYSPGAPITLVTDYVSQMTGTAGVQTPFSYLKYMGQLISENQVPVTILKPWNYIAPKDTPLLPDLLSTTTKATEGLIVKIAGIAALAAVSYLIITGTVKRRLTPASGPQASF
jgi:hypothetical protein